MTIRRGEPWGGAAPLPQGSPVASSNSELRKEVTAQREGCGQPAPIGVTGGDLWRVVGAPGGGTRRLRSDHAHTALIDIIEVTADGDRLWACVGVIARNSWWHGPVVAVMSADLAGSWRVAPAAHPNDGRLHVLETGLDGPGLSPRERMLARRRLRSGTHIPHPAISVRRVASAEYRFERPMALWLDGERLGRCRELSVAVVPDGAQMVF